MNWLDAGEVREYFEELICNAKGELVPKGADDGCRAYAKDAFIAALAASRTPEELHREYSPSRVMKDGSVFLSPDSYDDEFCEVIESARLLVKAMEGGAE